MTQHYYDVLFAFLLAQLLMVSVNVYFYQKQKEITYWLALKTYMWAEIGYFIIGIVAVCGLLFILSDFIDLSISRKDLLTKETLTWKEDLIVYFKTTAFCVGAFLQYIVFKLKEKGKAAIDKKVDVG